MDEDKTQREVAHDFMKQAFEVLKIVTDPSRENSLVKTKLEEAMMWNNKDRAIVGELKKSETHVE